jgi:SPW repeat
MVTQKPFTRSWGGWLGLLTLIAGLWFLISPWVLGFGIPDGFGTTDAAGLNAVIVGLLIAVCGALDAFGLGYLPVPAMRVFGVLATLLGLWAIGSTFVLNVAGIARWDAIVTGLVVILASGYDAWKLPSFVQVSHA